MFGNSGGGSIFGGGSNDSKSSIFGGGSNDSQSSIFGGGSNDSQSSIFGGGSNDSQSSIFGDSSKSEVKTSMFDSPSKPQGSMFDSPSTPQGSMFDSPSTPQGSMFDSPSTPQGSMFDSGSLDISGNSKSLEIENKMTKVNNQDLNFNDTEKYKAAYMIQETSAASLNVRGGNYGQMNLLDRMRGLQANRLNMDLDNVSIAEQYSDSSLDKRAMGGLYNTTLTDIYSDSVKYAAHHGLTADGIIDITDKEYNIDTYAASADEKKEFSMWGSDYVKEEKALGQAINHEISETKDSYKKEYDNPIQNFNKSERHLSKDSGLEYQQDPGVNNFNSAGSVTKSALDIAGSDEEVKELTPGEKFKLKKQESDLLEKEAKEEKKLNEKNEKKRLKLEKKELSAQEHINKVSESLKKEEETSMYTKKDDSDTSNSTETSVIGSLSSLDITSGSDTKKYKSAYEEDDDEDNIFAKADNSQVKNINKAMYKMDSKKKDEEEDILSSAQQGSSSKGLYSSNPMDSLGEKDLLPGEKLKLEKEQKDLMEKEARAEKKVQEKLEKEQMKIERKELSAQEHINKISNAYKTKEVSMFANKEDSKTEDNSNISIFGGLTGIDIGSGSSGNKKYKSVYDKDEEDEEKDNIFAKADNSQVKKINKAMYKMDSKKKDDEEEDILSSAQQGSSSKGLYSSNPMDSLGEKDLLPGDKLKLEKEQKDLMEKEAREQTKMQSKLEKEQMKKEKRELEAQENINKISQSYKTENTSIFQDNKKDETKEDNSKSAILGGLSGIDLGSGTTGSEKKKYKNAFDKEDEEDEELDNIFARKDHSFIKNINKLMYRNKKDKDEEDDIFSKKTKKKTYEKEKKKKKEKLVINKPTRKLGAIYEKTGFINETDDERIFEGKANTGSVREDIILPNVATTIKSENPLNESKDKKDDSTVLTENIKKSTEKAKIILNSNDEKEVENDGAEFFKNKAPIVAKETKGEERKVASDLKEKANIDEIKRWEEEKKSKMPDEVIEDPNFDQESKKGILDEELKEAEEKIKRLMERLSIDSIEQYLRKIYSKKEKNKIDRLKIKIGEEIISAGH